MIRYAHSDEAWRNVKGHIASLIEKVGARKVLEVGAGANPLFDQGFVGHHRLEYTLLDISKEELAKAPAGYKTVVADISARDLSIRSQYDFVFSRMLAEHVQDGRRFHSNILGLLVPGGTAFHFFPTLYSLPFVINRLVPERLSNAILQLLQTGRQKEGNLAKFPAYYSWCRGPTKGQVARIELLGYHVDDYIGFFGNAGYYQKIPLATRANRSIASFLLKHPDPYFCAFAYLTLSRLSK